MKTVLVIATLDTKGREALYLKKRIEDLGCRTILMDLSMRKGSFCSEADIKCEDVAREGGLDYQDVLASKDRSSITSAMTKGACRIAKRLFDEGKIHGVISIGGSTGTLMSTDVMRSLPFGLPKLCVSSTAALPGMATRYIGTGDICLFYSVVELSGLSRVLRNVLDRAARAICSMAEAESLVDLTSGAGETMVAMSMLGPCEKCASRVREALEKKGFQVVGFSASGVADRVMEDMVRRGMFQGVVDLATGGVIEHIIGGMRDAGPHRMEAAGDVGIPQVVSTCGLNHITPPKRAYTEDHKRRRKYDLDRYRTWLRASVEELREAAKAFSEKLNKAKGPVKVVVPLRGWSSVDSPGSPTYDPDEDKIFVDELKKLLRDDIEVVEVDANMEDPEFSEEVVKAFLELMGRGGM